MNTLAKKKTLKIKQKQRFKKKKEKRGKKKRKMDIYLSVQNLLQSKKYRISLKRLKRTPKYKVIRFIRNHFSKREIEGFLPQYYVVKILNSPTKKKSSTKHGHPKSTRSKDVFASEGRDEKVSLLNEYDRFGYFLGPHFTFPSTSEEITSPEINRNEPSASFKDANTTTETDVFDELTIGNQTIMAPNSSDAFTQYEKLPNILEVPSTWNEMVSPEINRNEPSTSLQDANTTTETDVFDELTIGNQTIADQNSSDAFAQYEELPNILDDVIDINHPVGLTEEITSAESMQWEKEIFSFEDKNSIDTGIWNMIYEKLPEEYNIPDPEFVSDLQQKKQELSEPIIKNETTIENTE